MSKASHELQMGKIFWAHSQIRAWKLLHQLTVASAKLHWNQERIMSRIYQLIHSWQEMVAFIFTLKSLFSLLTKCYALTTFVSCIRLYGRPIKRYLYFLSDSITFLMIIHLVASCDNEISTCIPETPHRILRLSPWIFLFRDSVNWQSFSYRLFRFWLEVSCAACLETETKQKCLSHFKYL